MRFATIGAGAIGQAVATRLVAARHPVALSNRSGPAGLAGALAALGTLASAATRAEAATAGVVFLSVMWRDVEAALDGLPDWGGRILVDTTNQFEQVDGEFRVVDTAAAFSLSTGSEVVAARAPGARVVKAFNTLYAREIARDPRHDGGRRVLFFAGDDPDAKAEFGKLVDELGFAPVDLGRLREGGRLMQAGGPLAGLHLLTQDV